MRRFIGAFWGLLVCVLITMCGGCKTKKAVAVETLKSTYSSTSAVKEKTEAHYSFIDTTKMDEFTSVIREYIFDTPTFCTADSFAHDTNVGSKSPMVEYKGDGSVIIHHGLKSIKETKISRKSEKKGMSEQKDSIGNKQSNTKASTTEHKKQKHKQVEQVQISEPFQWWQLIIGASVLFAVACLLFYLKRNKPKVKDIISNIRNRIKLKLE
ncbi:hypothetical protein [Prevotella pallens]|uniref:hypothetical protein n=1 Tax=Prevotella pallens TaxID=60133 RepID=UPI001CAF9715|nr:hypothetical protein [Prevotella pallens]MBF1517235.1 hypothetical protein [Prevotella pallens]